MNSISATAMSHVNHLAVDIGSRPAGSPGNQAAAEYIEGIFCDIGLAVEQQMFDCTTWEHDETRIEVDGISYEGSANWRSLPCDVTGVVVPVGTIDVLEQANLAGSIALLYGELTQDEIAPRTSTVYYPESHRKLNELLDKKKPLGVITVCPLLQSLRHVFKDPVMEIPSATVMPQVGLELLRHAGQAMRLKIVSRRAQGKAWNILGTRAGAGLKRIVISAHYDTVWGTPGAFDNASGVGVMLTLAQMLAGQSLPVGLEFYASNGEEFGGQGTIAYLEQYGLKEMPFRWDRPVGEYSKIWEPILANINIDGVGLALSANNVTAIAAPETLTDWIERTRKQKYPGIVHVDPWPASDQYTFYSHGVPSIPFSSTGGVVNHHHQPADTIQWISPPKLAEVVQFALEMIDHLSLLA